MVPEISSTTDRIFVILGYFLPFYLPPPTPEKPGKSNFEKMKKTPGDIINFRHEYHKLKSYYV